jgi:hypothetical protein
VAFLQQEKGCTFVDISSPLTFSGVFAKLRKVTINIVMPVRLFFRPSVRVEKLGFHWKDFLKIWYLTIFRKTVEKI